VIRSRRHEPCFKVGRARHQLLTFCDFPGDVEAGVRTAVDTAPLAGAGPFKTLLEITAL
jgi:hypothetical protein